MQSFFDRILASSSHRICVIAAPGSGKTSRVIMPKAKLLLADGSIAADEVLLLTFSRLSAIDLKNKVKTLERAPRASTVHSFCLQFLLSEDNHSIRKRVESILLDFEKEPLLSDLKLVFPKLKKNDLRKMLNQFSAGWATKPHDEIFEENEAHRQFKFAVINWLSEHEAAMMEEIVYHAVDLAKQLDCSQFLERQRYIFVDEFQDLNRLEQEFIELLARDSKLLVIVGDPDQSIYSFKYAYPSGISEFGQRPDVELYTNLVTGRCPKVIVELANRLLRQGNPDRTEMLSPVDGAQPGEVHFLQAQRQSAEFLSVLNSIRDKIKAGVSPDHILVLVPRKKLGHDFVGYAIAQSKTLGLPSSVTFAFVSKREFSDLEKERLLLFALLARPNSLLHIRTYIGLGDETEFAAEVEALKRKCGNLDTVIDKASADEFQKTRTRIRRLCGRIATLKTFLSAHAAAAEDSALDLAGVIDELFPEAQVELADVRNMLRQLTEDGDTPETLYAKFVDYMRTIPTDTDTVRVLTLMGSKGLEADHVYIIGCNAGNMPGANRSSTISDHEHKQEARRLLYVGFTRASKSLTVSWSRYIQFRQSKGHHTSSVGTRIFSGQTYSQVGMCEFLEDLGITWEHV